MAYYEKGKAGARTIRGIMVDIVLLACEQVGPMLQCRPNTAILMQLEHIDKTYEACGFSKVCWPDRWDPVRGYGLALEKACSKIAEQILADCGDDRSTLVAFQIDMELEDEDSDQLIEALP